MLLYNTWDPENRGACHWSLPLRWLWWHLVGHRHQTCLQWPILPESMEVKNGCISNRIVSFHLRVIFHFHDYGRNGGNSKFSSQNKQICGGLCGNCSICMAPETYSVHILFSTKIGPMFQKLALFESNLSLKFPRAKIIMNHPESSMDHHDMRCKKKGDAFHLWSTERAFWRLCCLRSHRWGLPLSMAPLKGWPFKHGPSKRSAGEAKGMPGHKKRKQEIRLARESMQIVMMDWIEFVRLHCIFWYCHGVN